MDKRLYRSYHQLFLRYVAVSTEFLLFYFPILKDLQYWIRTKEPLSIMRARRHFQKDRSKLFQSYPSEASRWSSRRHGGWRVIIVTLKFTFRKGRYWLSDIRKLLKLGSEEFSMQLSLQPRQRNTKILENLSQESWEFLTTPKEL